MITIKESGLLARWAYLLSDYTPCQTTLCTLFWRSVLLTPIKLIGVGVFLGALLYVLIWLPFKEFGLFGPLIAPLFTGFLVLWFIVLGKIKERWSDNDYPEPSIIMEGLRGIKEKYCPIVRIES